MYKTLRGQLGKSYAVRPAARTKPTFGAHLLYADSNDGPALLDANRMAGVDITLDRFQEMGIKGVTLVIGYPLFTPSRNPDSAQYVDFYRTVAAHIRARGMKLAIEQIVLWSNTNFSPWTFDLSGLTMAQLTADQHQMAQTIIDQLHPDYLNVLHEPDTFAFTSGLNQFYDPDVAAGYVSGVLQGLNRGATKVGAGSGTWLGPEYAKRIVQTDIDFLSLHIYWVDPTSLATGKQMVAEARAQGKRVLIDEAWLYKSLGEGIEGVPGAAANELGFRRDVFDFFAPLDRRFLNQMVRFAKTSGAEYLSPYWENYFFAYLPYDDSTKDLSYKDLVLGLAPLAVGQAIIDDRFTLTGKRYASLIRHNR